MRIPPLLGSVLLLGSCLAASTASAAPLAVVSLRKNPEGVTLKLNPGTLRLQVFTPSVIRVTYGAGDSLPATRSFSVISRPVRVPWKLTETAEEIRLRTDELEVRVDRSSGAIGFYSKDGKAMLVETANGGKSLTPARVGGMDTLRSEQDFELAPEEAIYGLGQHQQGWMNYRGKTVHLQQKNMEVGVPVLVSSRGYGLLWDNPAVTDVNVGASRGSSDEPPPARPDVLSWSSEAADTIDYYFMYGPELDQVIAAYRHLTGAAPMFGKRAWGFWQCKERYQSQQELLDVVGRYRKDHVPIDGIIQDWQYWTPHPWGSHQFDENRYPDPAKMLKDLHAANVHVLISVWPKFDVDSPNANALRAAGGLYAPVIPYVYPPGKGQWYDPFSSAAREIYWRQISRQLFAIGIDGWWLDAPEPELSGKWGDTGTSPPRPVRGRACSMPTPCCTAAECSPGQRAETSSKRVFILTRSAWAGQQRNAAVTWSGDIRGNWDVFAKQIPAGINFSLSGIPYWNTDTGGFFGGSPDNAGYRELFTRWFQFSAFCPMFRVHGSRQPKEMWRFDEPTQKILVDYDQLRYHLLPYIYSVSWKVTRDGYSMMRGLVMDFRGDTNVYNIRDQYLFGPALMVNPVTQAGATNRNVYLPAGANWTDFWTGKSYSGGQSMEAAAPVDRMPLFVRAGSILPYGPSIEYAMEKADPIELRVYAGADGAFTLYEDEGDNYNYEKGACATIPFHWNESTRTLQIGKRRGNFHGMLKTRTFRVVWVSPDHGTGIPATGEADVIVHYTGQAVNVSAGK